MWEVSWRLNKDCNIVTSSSSVFNSTSFSLCWAAQPGVSNSNNWLQTNWTSCRISLYHCFPSTCFLWASHLHPIQPVHSHSYTLISSTGCTCSLIDGWVEGQYVTSPSRPLFRTFRNKRKRKETDWIFIHKRCCSSSRYTTNPDSTIYEHGKASKICSSVRQSLRYFAQVFLYPAILLFLIKRDLLMKTNKVTPWGPRWSDSYCENFVTLP